MRQVVLDTETTGMELADGHRIIEIGCVELVNRRDTGRHFHRYVCPERDVDDASLRVHGLRREFLASQPRFAEIANELLEFLAGAELVIHNAAFDVAFLDMELARLAERRTIAAVCQVLDTLTLARQMHPGQRNNLDALCRRYSIDSSHRDLHGALLDAKLLASVYLAMTGGQGALTLGIGGDIGGIAVPVVARALKPLVPLIVIRASTLELEAHERALAAIGKASSGRCVWHRPQVEP
jgi:DNA polymerase-3 subunit epsilon